MKSRSSEDKKFWRQKAQKKLTSSEALSSSEASSPEADVIRSSKEHQKLKDWSFSNVVQMMILSRLSSEKTRNMKQWIVQKDLKALDAYSLESVEKGHLYEVYNHYLHYSDFMSASTRTTVVPATVFLQTWNGFEIAPS